jgi:hypothetical protein
METTRKSEFGRILVAVLDPKLIPRTLDVVIGDHYFDLFLKWRKGALMRMGKKLTFFGKAGMVKERVKERERRRNQGQTMMPT